MVTFVKLFGIFIAGFGLAYFVNPNMIKQYMAFWKNRKRLYMGGVLSLVIGAIFLFAASQCRWRGFVVAFGILAIAKGTWLVISPPEKLISMLDWWAKRPIAFLRGHAVFAVIIGVLLVYSA